MRLRLELAVPPEQAAGLWRHAALAGRGRPRGMAESWHWLDSAEGVLAEAGLALRAGTRGGRRLCPLRAPDAAEPPAPPPPDRHRSPPESGQQPSSLPVPGLAAPEGRVLPAEAVPEEAGGATLLPVAHFEGRLAQSPPDAAGVSLEWRTGMLTAGSLAAGASAAGSLAAGGAVQPVARLSLEGPETAVLALAAALPALPALTSLDEAALALARGTAAAPPRRGAPDLGGAATPDDALALAIAHLAGVLLAYAPLARPEAGPVAVHQLRVAARRLRSCLRAFRPMRDGPAPRALDAGLRDLARALGEAREWDVFLGGLGAELAAVLGPDRRWARLLRAAEGRRLEAYARLRVLLEGEAFRTLIWQAVRLAVTRDWDRPRVGRPMAAVPKDAGPRDAGPEDAGPEDTGPEGAQAEGGAPEPSLRAQAAALLARRRRKLLKGGRAIESLDDHALHELRLEAKRLRYVAELFAPLWPGKAARRFLRRVAGLQEALGLSNDTVAARALVASLGAAGGAAAGGGMAGGGMAGGARRRGTPGWAIGLAEGWALAAGQDTRPAALAAWRRFLRADPFWEKG